MKNMFFKEDIQMKYFHIRLILLGFINELPKELEISTNNGKRVVGDYKVHYVSDKDCDIEIIEVKNSLVIQLIYIK